MDMEAKIQVAWCLNLFKICEVFGVLLFHRVKIKIPSESMGPVVLISSSLGESNQSKSNKKSEDYVFFNTFLYGGTEKNGMTHSFNPLLLRRLPYIYSYHFCT